MASILWDIAQVNKRLVESLNDFLFEDGKPLRKGGVPGIYKEHTEEEYREQLKAIQEEALWSYEQIASELGWK